MCPKCKSLIITLLTYQTFSELRGLTGAVLPAVDSFIRLFIFGGDHLSGSWGKLEPIPVLTERIAGHSLDPCPSQGSVIIETTRYVLISSLMIH